MGLKTNGDASPNGGVWRMVGRWKMETSLGHRPNLLALSNRFSITLAKELQPTKVTSITSSTSSEFGDGNASRDGTEFQTRTTSERNRSSDATCFGNSASTRWNFRGDVRSFGVTATYRKSLPRIYGVVHFRSRTRLTREHSKKLVSRSHSETDSKFQSFQSADVREIKRRRSRHEARRLTGSKFLDEKSGSGLLLLPLLAWFGRESLYARFLFFWFWTLFFDAIAQISFEDSVLKSRASVMTVAEVSEWSLVEGDESGLS